MNRQLCLSRSAAPLALLALLTLIPAAFAQSGAPGAARQPRTAFPFSKTGTYAVVSVTNPKFHAAIPATDLATIRKMVGKEITIQGTITKEFIPSNKSIVGLDFAKDYTKAIAVVLSADKGPAFPDLAPLNGKLVVVTGKVSLYRGYPQIMLYKPDQIASVK